MLDILRKANSGLVMWCTESQVILVKEISNLEMSDQFANLKNLEEVWLDRVLTSLISICELFYANVD